MGLNPYASDDPRHIVWRKGFEDGLADIEGQEPSEPPIHAYRSGWSDGFNVARLNRRAEL
jgi:hypothetical protein